jgi:hypothetical protein
MTGSRLPRAPMVRAPFWRVPAGPRRADQLQLEVLAGPGSLASVGASRGGGQPRPGGPGPALSALEPPSANDSQPTAPAAGRPSRPGSHRPERCGRLGHRPGSGPGDAPHFESLELRAAMIRATNAELTHKAFAGP